MATEVRKREYELAEPEYLDNRVRREIGRYGNAIVSEKKFLESLGPKVSATKKERTAWKIGHWEKQLARLKSGEWKQVNANYLHEQYAKMVKKAISTGQSVPPHIISQAPEYKAAQTARERYEKGWRTSFANRSVAINEQMKDELGYKVKRQDGKPITSAQIDEIAEGVGEVEQVLGPLHDLFDKTDITIVHTSGKHPFLTGFGGTYTPREKAVNIGVDKVKALGHEVGHWLDNESGKEERLSTRLWGKTGQKAFESTSTAEAWESRFKDQKPTPLGSLIQDATRNINDLYEVRDLMKATYGRGLSSEEQAEAKLVRERLSPYWREPREVWARLVEQYIATKNKEGGAATDSPGFYQKTPGWWTKEGFAKLMPQVEGQIKTRLKALRGSDVIPARKKSAESKLENLAEDVKEIEEQGLEKHFTDPSKEKEEPIMPLTAPGQPEAGLQTDIYGGTKPFTPKGKGKAVTASMDAQVKLEQAQAEAKEAKEQTTEVKEEAAELKDTLGTLSQEDAAELLAGLDLRTEKLGDNIYEGESTLEAMKENLDPAIAKLTKLIPTTKEGASEITHITKGQYKEVWGREPKPNILTKDGKRIRWEYALDEIAQELHLEQKAQTEGRNPDEYLKDLIEQAKDTKALIQATGAEIESDEQTLKALEKLKGTIKARTTGATTGKLLQKIAKPKVTAAAAPKPETKAKVIAASVAQELIEKIQAARSAWAIQMDNRLQAVEVLSMDQVEKWAKHPNRVDLQGVDTPGPGRIVANVGYADKGKKRLSRKRRGSVRRKIQYA